MEYFAIVRGRGISLNSSQEFNGWMKSRFRGNLTAVEVKGEGMAVAEFVSGAREVLQRSDSSEMMFAGHPLELHQAYLIWMPFSLPTDSPVSTPSHPHTLTPSHPPSCPTRQRRQVTTSRPAGSRTMKK